MYDAWRDVQLAMRVDGEMCLVEIDSTRAEGQRGKRSQQGCEIFSGYSGETAHVNNQAFRIVSSMIISSPGCKLECYIKIASPHVASHTRLSNL
jgi:hypothetical protein